MRVLIADDSLMIRELLTELLHEVDGMEIVAQAEDASQARELARALRPDVAVLDVRMPHGSGLEVLSAIKQNDPTTIVIMLTNFANQEIRQKSVDSGANYFFDKAVELGRFMSVLRRLSHFSCMKHPLPPPTGRPGTVGWDEAKPNPS